MKQIVKNEEDALNIGSILEVELWRRERQTETGGGSRGY